MIGISGGGSSRRSRSIKDCRARGRRRKKYTAEFQNCLIFIGTNRELSTR
jgi:hypothetical protein